VIQQVMNKLQVTVKSTNSNTRNSLSTICKRQTDSPKRTIKEPCIYQKSPVYARNSLSTTYKQQSIQKTVNRQYVRDIRRHVRGELEVRVYRQIVSDKLEGTVDRQHVRDNRRQVIDKLEVAVDRQDVRDNRRQAQK